GLADHLDHVDGLDVAALLELVELLDVEADRLAVLRRAVLSRLAALCIASLVARLRRAVMSRLRSLCTAALRTPTPLLRPKEAARILNVSVDWVRVHGRELADARERAAGVTRSDPISVERLRRGRARRTPPRD